MRTTILFLFFCLLSFQAARAASSASEAEKAQAYLIALDQYSTLAEAQFLQESCSVLGSELATELELRFKKIDEDLREQFPEYSFGEFDWFNDETNSKSEIDCDNARNGILTGLIRLRDLTDVLYYGEIDLNQPLEKAKFNVFYSVWSAYLTAQDCSFDETVKSDAKDVFTEAYSIMKQAYGEPVLWQHGHFAKLAQERLYQKEGKCTITVEDHVKRLLSGKEYVMMLLSFEGEL